MNSEAIAKIIVKHEGMWGVNLTQAERERWYAEMGKLNVSAPTALYQSFVDQRPPSARIPRLGDVAPWFRKHSFRRPEPGGQDHGIRCGFCRDSGWMPIAAPRKRKDKGVTPIMQGFSPTERWTDTPVYETTVPCVCSRGQKVQGRHRVATEWLALRDRWLDVLKAQKGKVGLGELVLKYCVWCWQGSPNRYSGEAVLDVPEPALAF